MHLSLRIIFPSFISDNVILQLAASDLDSILPRSSEPNRYGGRWTELKYNENDVAELAVHLNAVLFTENAPLATAVGPEIARLDAMIQYKVRGLVDWYFQCRR